MNVRFASLALLAAALAVGCGPPKVSFVRYTTVAHKFAQDQMGQPEFSSEQWRDIDLTMAMLFGTPDNPVIPALEGGEVGQMMSLSRLKMAAGPVGSDEQGNPRGLYREHCAHCHGITGDGAGPTAVFLNPYPRDYRLGLFKFKSTPDKLRPTHEDLKKTVLEGIPGTAMPSFKLLPDVEVEALVDYVKYLSLRGEVERELLMRTSQLTEGRLMTVVAKAPASAEKAAGKAPTPEEAAQQAQLDAVREAVKDIAGRWNSAKSAEVPARPEMDEQKLAASVARGRELFYGTIANCIKCHGDSALGDGVTNDYEDWVKDLYDPSKEPKAAREYLARGMLPPRNARPRNLRLGVFRGGHRPLDIYWRLTNGIAGTPMPKVLMKPEGDPNAKGLVPSDVWDLVNYVQSLAYEPINNPLAAASEAENLRITP